MQALPLAAYFLFLEAAVGGIFALAWVFVRGEVSRGFTLFTGWILFGSAALAIWLRGAFPPAVVPEIETLSGFWYSLERPLSLAFAVTLALVLALLQANRLDGARRLATLPPLLGLCTLWAAALVEPGRQLGGVGAALAAVAGAVALGASLTGLSLGHWYLVTPTLSIRPLVRVSFLCLGALVAQAVLLPILLASAAQSGVDLNAFVADHGLFFSVRVLFGILIPLLLAVMTWRTARIRSLDSATGLLYVLATLVLAGEIVARSLFFLTDVAT